MCGEAISTVTQVGPVSYVLHPCGHQVDDGVYNDLVNEDANGRAG